MQKQKEIPETRASSQIEVEDDEIEILFIDELTKEGINQGDLQKLKSAGICTVIGVLMQ